MDAEQSHERYDRQIRLWGQHGQCKCSSSRVCLVNADSLGTEILKSLCLAGVGSITILDSHKLTAEDLGSIPVSREFVGKSRASAVVDFLSQLNDSVHLEVFNLETHLPHVTDDKEIHCDEFSAKPSFWTQYNCIIASGSLKIGQIKALSRICWMINRPVILCKSLGFYGLMQNQIREHIIIESHPETNLPDLDLVNPFDDLRRYMDSTPEIEKLSRYPYSVIIYKYLKVWQEMNAHSATRIPESYMERCELKSLIESGTQNLTRRIDTNDPGDIPYENYIEASKAINTCLRSNDIPTNLKEIFDYDAPLQTSKFWVIIRAIKEYVRRNGQRLPLSGTIPDMTSDSEEYIKLQNIYKRKANEDVDGVFSVLQESDNMPPGCTSDAIYDEIKLLCKNIRDLRVVKTTPLFESQNSIWALDGPQNELICDDEQDEPLTISICMNATDIFYTNYGRLPGCQGDDFETDISKMRECVKQIIGNAYNKLKYMDDCIYEVCRYGGLELHATSAFMGGCVAQEVIKLLTNQYTPVEHALVYNAMSACVTNLRLCSPP